jgi:hypothetical protein
VFVAFGSHWHMREIKGPPFNCLPFNISCWAVPPLARTGRSAAVFVHLRRLRLEPVEAPGGRGLDVPSSTAPAVRSGLGPWQVVLLEALAQQHQQARRAGLETNRGDDDGRADEVAVGRGSHAPKAT